MEEAKKMLNDLNLIKCKAIECIENSPEGKIYISKSGNTDQYHLFNEKNKKIYIKKQDIALVQQLVQKEYAQKLLQIINKQEKNIKQFIRNCDKYSLVKVYENMPEGKKKLVNPYMISDEEYISKWEKEKNKILIEKENDERLQQLGIITEKGEYVRSKTEKIIADKLFSLGIPYVYELPHFLQGYGYVYSDFTILNVKTKQEYIWEHFGLMGDEKYVQNSIKKINTYAKNGYIQGKNFITTFEGGDVSLSTNVIKGIAENLLL